MASRAKVVASTRERIYNMFGGRCAYCGCEMYREEFEIDHIVPHVKGGRTPNNLFPACSVCNNAKSTMTIEEFRKHLEGKAFLKPGVKLIARYYDIEPKHIVFHFEEVGFDLEKMLNTREIV